MHIYMHIYNLFIYTNIYLYKICMPIVCVCVLHTYICTHIYGGLTARVQNPSLHIKPQESYSNSLCLSFPICKGN